MSVWRLATLLTMGALLPPATGGKAKALQAHFYYVDDDAAWESLSKNIGAVDLLSPVWLYLQTSGEVRVAVDARVKQLATQSGVPLIPVVMNENFKPEAARTAFDEQRQDAIIASLLKTVVAEGFAGLQLDFENLAPSDRDAYAQFTERLAAAMRAQKKSLSVAVVSPLFAEIPATAKTESWQPTPRSLAYDYERLARASDFLTLMTYDQYTSPNSPGPVAGIGWMEACVRKLLESAPAAKVFLGVPLYHRHWAAKQVTTGTWFEAQQLSWRAKAGTTLDTLHEEPVIRFRDGSTDHVIWYHNAESVKRRIELAKRFRLRGYSAWRIGQEDPSVWTEGIGKP